MKYLEKIIEYGLYLFVFTLPIQTRWIIKAGIIDKDYFEYGTISFYGTDILLVFLLFLFFILKILKPRIKNNELEITEKKNKIIIHNSLFGIPIYWWIVAGLELFVFISIFVASNKTLALYRYGVFLSAIGLFWLIIEANFNQLKLLYSFLASVFLQALLGIWQFLSQSSFALKWLGLAEHKAGTLGTSVVEFIASDGIGERWLRAYGGLDHPNMLGGLLVVGIVITIYLLTNLFAVTENPKIRKQKISLYILFYIFFVGLFFTFSRGAWVAALVGIFLIFLPLIIKRKYFAQKEMLIIILCAGLLLFGLVWRYNELVTTRLSNNTRLEVKSSFERVVYYQEAWQLIKKHPFLGVGMGNFSLAVKNEITPKEPSWYYQPTHNVFLLVWAETGIIGLISFACLLAYILIFNFPLFKIAKSKLNILNISIGIAIIITMLVDHYWWSLHFGILFFWFIMGLVLREEKLQIPDKVIE